MSLLARFAVPYRSALKDALIIQVPLILLSGFAADFGVMAIASLRASAVFWTATAVILLRRPTIPSRWDLIFIRFAYLGLFPITFVLMHKIPCWWVR